MCNAHVPQSSSLEIEVKIRGHPSTVRVIESVDPRAVYYLS